MRTKTMVKVQQVLIFTIRMALTRSRPHSSKGLSLSCHLKVQGV